jgi:hypothetical protein
LCLASPNRSRHSRSLLRRRELLTLLMSTLQPHRTRAKLMRSFRSPRQDPTPSLVFSQKVLRFFVSSQTHADPYIKTICIDIREVRHEQEWTEV